MAGRFKELKDQRFGKTATLDDVIVGGQPPKENSSPPPPPWAGLEKSRDAGLLHEEDLAAPEAGSSETVPDQTSQLLEGSHELAAPASPEVAPISPYTPNSPSTPAHPLQVALPPASPASAVPAKAANTALNAATARLAEATKGEWTAGWVTEQRRRGDYEKKLQSNEAWWPAALAVMGEAEHQNEMLITVLTLRLKLELEQGAP